MRSVLTEVRVTALHTLFHRKTVKWDATDTALLHVISVGLWHSLVRLARGNDPVKLVFISEFRLWFRIYIDLYILTSQLHKSVYD